MIKNIFASLDLDGIKSEADKLLKKTLNRHVKLAVTGLSRSGKSAFITSLVYQLCEQSNSKNLPFVESVRETRFIGAKKIPQTSLHVPSFAYQDALDSLFAQTPCWPDSTRSISELRLAIRFRPQEGILSQLSDWYTLHLDIIDYPGEWLMDLPMLAMDFADWSELMADLFAKEPRKTEAAAFMAELARLDLDAAADEQQLKGLAGQYSELLIKFKNEMGLSLLQPGRFILPGELEGAPILQFVPMLTIEGRDKLQDIKPGSNLEALQTRFEEYKNRVVKAFYNDYFKHFDRQIVLVDCLAPLNAGEQSFDELKRSLELILQSYDYGKNDILHRIFSPRIDKLLFAATKADHVTPDQHRNLTLLLNNLIEKSRKDVQFEGIEVDTMSMSSIKATEQGYVDHKGETFPCIKGTTVLEDEHKTVTLFPGEIPKELPTQSFWQNHQFDFVSFEPPKEKEECIKHIRMDHVIEFLIGDKLK